MFLFAADHGDVLIDIVKYLTRLIPGFKGMVTGLCEHVFSEGEWNVHCC
jgi:hypothetical protein